MQRESCTGWVVCQPGWTEVPGVSAFFKGAVVTYWTAMKIDVVHVNPAILDQYGVISEQTAKRWPSSARC